jgi:cell division protein ZapA
MAQVTLSIGGYSYQLACRDGEEDRLLQLGEIVDVKVQEARGAVGNAPEARQLLMAALLFADDSLEGVKATVPTPPSETRDADALEALAIRIEALASSLENAAISV